MDKKEIDLIEVFQNIIQKKERIFVLKSRFVNILKEQSVFSADFLSKEEIIWLANNLDFIEPIMKSDKAKGVLWYLHNYKEGYIQDISRKVCSYSTPVRYWILTLENCWLVESRTSTYGDKRVFYHLNYDQYPNIIGALLHLMVKKYGEEYLNKLITPKRRNDGTIIDKQTESVIKGRRRNSLI